MLRRLLLRSATALAVVAAPMTVPVAAVAQEAPDATVVPIQVTGPPAARFNLVILGDGYTADDMPRFRAQVDEHLNVLWSIEPFKSYREYVNVYAIEIESPDSGVDCDPDLDSPEFDTPLDMGFWGGCNPNSVQRLLTVDRRAAIDYANLVEGVGSSNRQLLAIANSDTYGGAGGSYATASGGNALSALITPHELGHSLGGLQDEYDYYGRGEEGAPYTGGEPSSIHHTLRTEQQMLDQQAKWWRWLGEESESGGVIGRYEGGMYAGSGIWRPSQHSMMKSLGYYFDQVSRERMTQRISSRTSLVQSSTPTTAPIGSDRVVWLETQHPVSHELDVTWRVDGQVLADTANARSLDLAALDLDGQHTVTATVVDPTDFVRDPAVRASNALTSTRSWTVDASLVTETGDVEPAITGSTGTAEPVGATDVVYVDTTHPVDQRWEVDWSLDGSGVSNPGNDRDLALGPMGLTGTHALRADLVDPATGAVVDSRQWQVDATDPQVSYELSEPLLEIATPDGPEYVFNGPFTMGLEATDDTDGYVVPEFRQNGDGWFNYFGWPTDADAPFLFTAEGTEIESLVYGKLGESRVVPWDEAAPGYGRHLIEYRAIDPAGNIGAAEGFVATLLPEPPACTDTISEPRSGKLVVASGVTCIHGTTVSGQVVVAAGASLVATDATITGPVRASSAATVQLLTTTVEGPVSLIGTTDDVTVVGSTVQGPLTLVDSTTDRDPVVAGTTVEGPLRCSGNDPAPVDLQAPNEVHGPATGQCADLG